MTESSWLISSMAQPRRAELLQRVEFITCAGENSVTRLLIETRRPFFVRRCERTSEFFQFAANNDSVDIAGVARQDDGRESIRQGDGVDVICANQNQVGLLAWSQRSTFVEEAIRFHALHG